MFCVWNVFGVCEPHYKWVSYNSAMFVNSGWRGWGWMVPLCDWSNMSKYWREEGDAPRFCSIKKKIHACLNVCVTLRMHVT